MLATDANPPNEPTAVRSMLDRPVAQIAAFVTACVAFWCRATIHPWRTGRGALATPDSAPPPFAWLVAMLFVAGIALRVFFAIDAIPPSAEVSLLGDLRTALGEVSLTGAVLTTLPCVLIVALPATALSRALGGKGRPDNDPLVAAVCHALGWQFGAVSIALAVLIVMQLAGMEPTGRLNDELNAVLPYFAVIAITWGALLLAPAIVSRARQSVALGLGGSLMFTGPVLVASLWTLGQSVDLRAAQQIAEARQHRAWLGDLDVDVLASEPLPNGLGKERHRLKIAYTSRSDRLLIVSRESEFTPQDGSAARRFRIVESSLDFLPDRALLIEPGQTRLAEYTIEPQPALIGATSDTGALAYRVPFHRREGDGGFLMGEGALYAPREMAAPRLTQTPSLRR